MSTPSSGSAGNGAGGERFDVRGDLEGISKIQHQLAVLCRRGNSRHVLHIVSDKEQMRPHMPLLCKQPTKPKKEVQEWNAHMSSLHAVQIPLEEKSGTSTAAGGLSTAEEKS